jgi:hypothetical protein
MWRGRLLRGYCTNFPLVFQDILRRRSSLALGGETVQKTIVSLFVIGLILSGSTCCKPKNDITQDELLRRTQELFDAVSAGDQTPWKKYFAEDCMYFDEKGRNMNKAALVADVTPLPADQNGEGAKPHRGECSDPEL